MAGVRASEKHPMIWRQLPTPVQGWAAVHLPDGAGQEGTLGPDGDAKSEGNELLLALGHFAPVSRGVGTTVSFTGRGLPLSPLRLMIFSSSHLGREGTAIQIPTKIIIIKKQGNAGSSLL